MNNRGIEQRYQDAIESHRYLTISKENEIADHLSKEENTILKVHLLHRDVCNDDISKHSLNVCLDITISYIRAGFTTDGNNLCRAETWSAQLRLEPFACLQRCVYLHSE